MPILIAEHSQSDEDLKNFFEAEMRSFVSQQEIRYRFFVDKHRDWTESYIELIKFFEGLNAVDGVPKETPPAVFVFFCKLLRASCLVNSRGHLVRRRSQSPRVRRDPRPPRKRTTTRCNLTP